MGSKGNRQKGDKTFGARIREKIRERKMRESDMKFRFARKQRFFSPKKAADKRLKKPENAFQFWSALCINDANLSQSNPRTQQKPRWRLFYRFRR
jgi:hypothetical protein